MCKRNNCRQIEQYINDFISSTITGDELSDFLDHVERCSACYEELEIRYLLAEALDRVENGETINIKKEIRDKIRMARFLLKHHKLCGVLYRSVQLIAYVIVTYAFINNVVKFL